MYIRGNSSKVEVINMTAGFFQDKRHNNSLGMLILVATGLLNLFAAIDVDVVSFIPLYQLWVFALNTFVLWWVAVGIYKREFR